MSQPLLTLRAPANVDWIQGYPGIPPSSQFDRPHAAVKGTIEVRPSQPLKAKWLRIELRKVETLPSNAGVFIDYVGQSPVTLWQAPNADDWGMLETCDFPFYVRIPESIPPSLNLEKGSGIRYELVATVCCKGKKGLLRKDATTTVSSTTQIIIDKHELHSTWPIYSQPETKQVRQGAVELIVSRTHTCYGPGDRVSVLATVKSDDLSACVLRTLEFALRETVIFRAGAGGHGKKGGPQVRSGGVGEQRINSNVTMYGGTQYRAELSCVIPPGHSTASVTTARHIDVSYTVHIRATLDNGKLLALELPVTLSNWPRQVSVEAVKRIGPATNLSLDGLLPHTAVPDVVSPHSPRQPTYHTLPGTTQQVATVRDSVAADQWGALPQRMESHTVPGRGLGHATAMSMDVTPTTRLNTHAASPSMPNGLDFMALPATAAAAVASPSIAPPPFGSASTPSSTSGRPLTGGSSSNGKKIDLLAGEDSVVGSTPPTPPPAQPRYPHGRRPSAFSSPTPAPAPGLPAVRESGSIRNWPTAEDEKRRLYEKAVTAANRTQSRIVTDNTGGASGSALHGRTQSASVSARPNGAPRRVTSMDSMSSSAASIPTMATGPTASDGPTLYQQALASMPRGQTTPVRQGSTPPQSPPARISQLPVSKAYPSASEEKAALAFEQARRAVERHQSHSQSSADAPIAYEALFPSGTDSIGHGQPGSPPAGSSRVLHTSPPATPPASRQMSLPGSSSSYQTSFGGGSSSAAAPPPFVPASPAFDPTIPEKERIRRAFEARDAAAAAAGIGVAPTYADGPSSMPIPAPYSLPSNGSVRTMSPMPEPSLPTSRTPPRSFSPPLSSQGHSSDTSARRPPPVPPVLPGSPQPLTAAEEKARLQAQYDADDGALRPSHTVGRPRTAGSVVEARDPEIKRGKMRAVEAPPSAPPLMPRPPKEYIQETLRRDTQSQEQLARLLASENLNFGDAPPLPPKVPL